MNRREFVKATAFATAATCVRHFTVNAAEISTAMVGQSPGLSLWYRQSARDWNEALPLGNGRVGAMVFGGTNQERIQLNEETLWTGVPTVPSRIESLGPQKLPDIRRLVFADKWSEAQALYDEAMRKGKWFAKYQPLGNLWLEFAGHESAADYHRELDLDTAIASVRYRVGEVEFVREAFVSPVDQVLVVSLATNRPKAIDFSVHLAGEVDDKGQPADESGALGLPPSEVRLIGLAEAFEGAPGGRLGYEGRLRVIPRGGRMRVDGDRIIVEKADSAVLLFAAATSFKNHRDVTGDPEALVKQCLALAARKSLKALRSAHVKEHQRLFRRVSLALPSATTSALPTDERLQKMAAGQDDPDLSALFFQFGRYLVISSSRPGTQPPNLQGIWNQDRNPAWDSKYTTNINLQMNYWPVEVANLSDCFEPLARMVRELSDVGRVNARDCFGARGWILGFNTDLWRTLGPVSGDGLSFWTTWQTGGAWLCTHLWEHYQFTGDRKFLKEFYPVMKGAAEFFLDTLQEHPRTKELVTCPSSSPENRHHKLEGKGWAQQPSVCAGPTMDMQILSDLFGQCAHAAAELGVDTSFRESLLTARARLAPTRIGRHGQVQEWLDDWDDPQDRHRHISHLYGLYPSAQLTPEATPDLVKAARVTLEQRGLVSTGWSMAWKVCWFARMRDGKSAHKGVRYLLGYRGDKAEEQGADYVGGVYPNLFSKCPPMQVDANFGACAGIAEMLLQSHGLDPFGADAATQIRLLPATPAAWPKGAVMGLCARGGFEVDLAWSDGTLTRAVVHSKLGRPCVVRYREHTVSLLTKRGKHYVLDAQLKPQRR